MTDKTAPVGICDHCNNPIPPSEWYHRRGPRRYCSRECRNAANSQNSKPVRTLKTRLNIALGRWRNPRTYLSEDENAKLNSEAARKGRLREVAEGRWRNPGLTPEARAKNSEAQRKRQQK